MFMAYNQLVSGRGVRGNTLEIGVYHGQSAIAVASLRGESGTFTAVDVFDDLQARDGSSLDVAQGRLSREHGGVVSTLEWLRLIVAPSSTVRADHSAARLLSHRWPPLRRGHLRDMQLCAEVVVPGGLVALDDYFSNGFPALRGRAVVREGIRGS